MESDQPRLRILLGEAITMGPGKAELLEHIRDTGSISAAARRMKMSYRRAWLLVETMNQSFKRPLVESSKGGVHGGGAQLTPMGEEALARYRAMEAKAYRAVAAQMDEFRMLLNEAAPED